MRPDLVELAENVAAKVGRRMRDDPFASGADAWEAMQAASAAENIIASLHPFKEERVQRAARRWALFYVEKTRYYLLALATASGVGVGKMHDLLTQVDALEEAIRQAGGMHPTGRPCPAPEEGKQDDRT